jgi:hypothetical protein
MTTRLNSWPGKARFSRHARGLQRHQWGPRPDRRRTPQVTGILERFDLTRTARFALLHPGTRRLIFITPQDETGTELRNSVDTTRAAATRPSGGALDRPRSVAHRRAPAAPAPGHTDLRAGLDSSAGRPAPLEPEEVTAFVHERTQLPVYSDLDTSVGHGSVGGYMNSGLETGRLQASMAPADTGRPGAFADSLCA